MGWSFWLTWVRKERWCTVSVDTTMRSTLWRGRRWPAKTPSPADLRTVKVADHFIETAVLHFFSMWVNSAQRSTFWQEKIETNLDFYHLKATSGASAGDEKGCYLASGSKDQTVRIWSSARGKGRRSRRGLTGISVFRQIFRLKLQIAGFYPHSFSPSDVYSRQCEKAFSKYLQVIKKPQNISAVC